MKQKYQPITYPTYLKKYVHHTAVYACDNKLNNDLLDKHLDTVFDCTNQDEIATELASCFLLQFGSVNVQEQVMMPKEAGLPLTSGTYLLTNIHVSNFEMIHLKLSHMMRIWHTGQLRKYEASFKLIGGNPGRVKSNWGAILPPKTSQFRTRHVLSTYCFNEV